MLSNDYTLSSAFTECPVTTKVFIGWFGGNLTNQRTISVASVLLMGLSQKFKSTDNLPPTT